ncbi:anti-repressor SinI family protein [Evansella sp. LMS18]|jgi:hypothetical protein|nr:anti-repressor SinI family protein [Evansella sp. LMS18]UTR11859.1 anti-repressor SinI family protein [Evansella sp. LMS18]
MQKVIETAAQKEWEELLLEAKKIGLTPTEIRNFLQAKKELKRA